MQDYGSAQAQNIGCEAVTRVRPPEPSGLSVLEDQVNGAMNQASVIEDRLASFAARLIGPRPETTLAEAPCPVEPHMQDRLADMIRTLNRISSSLDRIGA